MMKLEPEKVRNLFPSTQTAVPAFLAAALTTLSAFWAVADTLEDPLFNETVLLLIVAGYMLSFLRCCLAAPWVQTGGELVSIIGIAGIPLWAFLFEPGRLVPVTAVQNPDFIPVVIVTWVAVMATFLTGTRVGGLDYAPLSFAVIPSLSMQGLCATLNVNVQVTLAFIIWLLCATFLVSYETNLMRLARGSWFMVRDSAAPNRETQNTKHQTREWVRTHLHLTARLSVAALAGSLLLAPLLALLRPPLARITLPAARTTPPMKFPSNFASFFDTLSLRGGPISLSSTPYLKIRSRPWQRWRVRVYNRYEGDRWVCSLSQKEVSPLPNQPQTFVFPRPRSPVAQKLTAEVEVLAPPANQIVSAGLPIALHFLKGRAPERVQLDSADCLHASLFGRFELTYRITSFAVPEPSDPFAVHSPLLTAGSGPPTEDTIPPEVAADYLDFPSNLKKVYQMAHKVTAGAKTPYQKALILTRFLQDNYNYTFNPPLLPFGVNAPDAVTFFLFHSKQGACDMFASSLALMLRAVGVPSRVVTGFYSEEYDEKEGFLLVREQHAHAWVEAYIAGWGWVPFDASPSVPGRVGNQFLASLINRINSYIFMLSPYPVQFALALLLLVLTVPIAIRHRHRLLNLGSAFKLSAHPSTHQLVARRYLQMVRLLSALGFPRAHHLTPREYEKTLLGQPNLSPPLLNLIQRLTDAFVQSTYGGVEMSRQDVEELNRHLKQLFAHAKAVAPIRLLPKIWQHQLKDWWERA